MSVKGPPKKSAPPPPRASAPPPPPKKSKSAQMPNNGEATIADAAQLAGMAALAALSSFGQKLKKDVSTFTKDEVKRAGLDQIKMPSVNIGKKENPDKKDNDSEGTLKVLPTQSGNQPGWIFSLKQGMIQLPYSKNITKILNDKEIKPDTEIIFQVRTNKKTKKKEAYDIRRKYLKSKLFGNNGDKKDSEQLPPKNGLKLKKQGKRSSSTQLIGRASKPKKSVKRNAFNRSNEFNKKPSNNKSSNVKPSTVKSTNKKGSNKKGPNKKVSNSKAKTVNKKQNDDQKDEEKTQNTNNNNNRVAPKKINFSFLKNVKREDIISIPVKKPNDEAKKPPPPPPQAYQNTLAYNNKARQSVSRSHNEITYTPVDASQIKRDMNKKEMNTMLNRVNAVEYNNVEQASMKIKKNPNVKVRPKQPPQPKPKGNKGKFTFGLPKLKSTPNKAKSATNNGKQKPTGAPPKPNKSKSFNAKSTTNSNNALKKPKPITKYRSYDSNNNSNNKKKPTGLPPKPMAKKSKSYEIEIKPANVSDIKRKQFQNELKRVNSRAAVAYDNIASASMSPIKKKTNNSTNYNNINNSNNKTVSNGKSTNTLKSKPPPIPKDARKSNNKGSNILSKMKSFGSMRSLKSNKSTSSSVEDSKTNKIDNSVELGDMAVKKRPAMIVPQPKKGAKQLTQNQKQGIIKILPTKSKNGWIYHETGMFGIDKKWLKHFNDNKIRQGTPVIFSVTIGDKMANDITVTEYIDKSVVAKCLIGTQPPKKTKHDSDYFVTNTALQLTGTVTQNAFYKVEDSDTVQSLIDFGGNALNALLNTAGGGLYFGVDGEGQIYGLNSSKINIEKLTKGLYNQVSKFSPKGTNVQNRLVMTTICVIDVDGVVSKNKFILRCLIPGPLKNKKGDLIEFSTSKGNKYRKQLSYIVKYV